MGSGPSQVDYETPAVDLYRTALQNPCLLPDIGIDESLLKYSGTDSNSVLQTFSEELIRTTPGFGDRLGSSLAPLTVIPNAVGFGAFLISMIMEICIKTTLQSSSESYSILRRVFGEEKGSAVRDTMLEVMTRSEMFLDDDQQILVQMERFEVKLSHQLTVLRNSLMHDGQMSSRGFKIWVNGASFHVQMLIHEARLNVKAGRPASDFANSVKAAIEIYLRNLNEMFEKYKSFKTTKTDIRTHQICLGSYGGGCYTPYCLIEDKETKCLKRTDSYVSKELCGESEVKDLYMNHLFSTYEPVSGLKSHFSNMKNNLYTLIYQDGSFRVPSRT